MIEGCGSNGCEHITGGVVVILGSIDAELGASMAGGMAYPFDSDGKVAELINM